MNLKSAFISTALAMTMAAPLSAETLNWASRSSFVDMDPAATYSEETYILGNVYETLTWYENGEIKPRLAESWEPNEESTVWVVNLRDDVNFHDGSAMDAAAVKKSIEYTRDEGRGAGFLWAGLTSAEVTGEHQLTLTFGAPFAFDFVASGQYGSYIIAPAAIDQGHDWMQAGNAIGTGPYKLSQFDPGERVLLEKHDAYWGGWQEGHFDRAIIDIVTESSTRVQMLKSGAADIAVVPTDQIESVQSNDGVSVSQGDSWRNSMFLFNFDKYPTDNKEFRQALTHLWDYQSVLNDILTGTGKPPQGPLPASMWGSGKFDMPEFDMEKAMQLLEASGVPKSDWKVTVHYIGDVQSYAQSIELFQALAAEVGVEVELLPGEWGVIWQKAKNKDTAANMTSMTWWPAYATPGDWLFSQWATEENALFNLSFYSNPAYDTAVGEFFAAEAGDQAVAAEKSIAAQTILMEDVPAIFFADVQRYYGHSDTVKGMEAQFNPAYETLWIHKLSR